MPEREVTILARLTDKMSKPLRGLVGMFGKLGRAALVAGGLAKKSFRGIVRGIGFLSRSLLNLRNLIIIGIAAGIIKVFADFEKGITTVATLVDTTVVSMQELKEAVLDVSVATGESLGTLNEALFDIISAGVDAKQAGLVLLEASKLAKGGATSTAAATKGMVSIMNAYGLAVEDAAAVSDAFFQAQKAGITTVDQLARNIGKLAPTARLAGVSIDEMLAAVSAVTKQGISTTQAVTGMKSVFTALIKPTEGAKEAARKLTIQWDTSRLKGGKFVEFLAEVAEKTQLDEVVLAKLFPNVRAFGTFAALAAEGGKDFVDILASMADKTGATQEAFAKMGDTLTEIIAKGLAEVKRFFVNAGEAAKPFIVEVVNKIRDFVEGLNSKKAQITAFIRGVAGAIGQLGQIIGSIFRTGDIFRFIVNMITQGISLAVRLLTSSIPIIVQLARTLGRQFGIALIEGIIGASKEALARELGTGNELLRKGLRILGISEEELEDLAKQGREIIDLETGVLLAREELRQRSLAPGELPSPLRRGAQGVTDAQIEQRIADTERRLETIREGLQDSAFKAATEMDMLMIDELSKTLVEDGTQAFKDFFSGLPAGLSSDTKKLMEDLGEMLGPEWNKMMQDALVLDEETKRKLAEEAAKGAEGAVGGAPRGTGIEDSGAVSADFNAQLSDAKNRMEALKSSTMEYRTQLQMIRDLSEGGFITRDVARKREIQLQEDFNANLKITEDLILSIQKGFEGKEARAKLYAEELAVMSGRIAQVKAEISGADVETGTFFTGLQAGILNTIETLGDLRATGLAAGQSIASALGDGVVTALSKGKEAFKEWGLSFLRQMSSMILKAMIFKAIMAGLGAAGVGFNEGGGIGFMAGGLVPGPNVNRDVVSAKLTPREFVQPRGTVDYYGPQVMEALRRRLIPKSALASYGRTVRPIPSGRFLQSGGQPSGGEQVGPSPAYIVPSNQSLERQLAAGSKAFMRFLRENSRDVKSALE